MKSMKVIIISHFAESLVNIRGPMLAALVDAGHRVTACAPGEDRGVITRLKELGVTYETIALDPAGINPMKDLRSLLSLTKLLRRTCPEVVLSYSTKPIIYGSLAAWLAGVPRRFSLLQGLGIAVSALTVKQRVARTLVRKLYRVSLARNHGVFFENPDDLAFFVDSKLVGDPKQAIVLNGAGVDLDHFREVQPYTGHPVFLLVARLVREKGVVEYVEAARILKSRHPHAEFHVIGALSSNPSRISEAQIKGWQQEGIIKYLGAVKDVRPFIENASVVVLPSYREGTPRAMLEAMAMGRPIVTTDVPGCRETVVEGENGFLVPVEDAVTLADAMERFILCPNLIVYMGKLSRKIAAEKYDVQKVNATIMRTMGLSGDVVPTEVS